MDRRAVGWSAGCHVDQDHSRSSKGLPNLPKRLAHVGAHPPTHSHQDHIINIFVANKLRAGHSQGAGKIGMKKVNSEDFSLLVAFLLVTFSWLFRGFFVAFSWPSSV